MVWNDSESELAWWEDRFEAALLCQPCPLGIVQTALEHGVHPNQTIHVRGIATSTTTTTTTTTTPLYCAIYSSNLALLRILVQAGADVNAPFRCATRPLEWLIYIHNRWQHPVTITMARLLIQYGANLRCFSSRTKSCSNNNTRNDDDGTIGLTLAHQATSPAMLSLLHDILRERCARGTTVLQHAVWMNQYEKVAYLLQHYRVCSHDNNNNKNSRSCCCLDEELEATTQCVDIPNVTALQLAVGGPAGQRGTAMAELLVEAGANVHVMDSQGRALVDLAQSAEMVEVLQGVGSIVRETEMG